MRRERFAYDRVVIGNGLIGHQFLLDVEPWGDPDIFDVEHEAQEHLDGQADHGEEKNHQDGVLQQALALIILGIIAAIQRMHEKTANGEESADNRGAEDGFAEVGGDAEKIRQIAIDLVDEAVVIPGLAGPEPLPAGAANEGADGDHRYPENNEAEEERAYFEFALLPGVIAGAERVGVNIRDHHQAEDDECGHDHAGNPRVEVDQHFLKAEEIPRGLRGVHGEVGIGGLFQRRIQCDGPDHQNDGDDDGGEEFDTEEEWPDVNFFLPPGLEGPRLTVMRLGQGGVAFELLDEQVVGVRLAPSEKNIESEQWDERDDRHIVRRGHDFPKLAPVHGYFLGSLISDSSITEFGPEIPPSLRTRQKCTIMKIRAMMGMPMQCQMYERRRALASTIEPPSRPKRTSL